MIRYLVFWLRMARCALVGGRSYYLWLGTLGVFLAMGVVSWSHHLSDGLIVTRMNDHVPWGIGIANFVYFVGVAAGAAVLVVPAYGFKRADIKEVVLLGEILAVVAVVMCLLYILTDIGRPERLWHLMPPVGILNLPSSLLSWDVVVFSGYLAMNLHIPGYLLYARYLGNKPRPAAYLPLVFLSMLWAVSIHTVTAFLLCGLGSRPFWNTPILASRFLISAGASAPALLILMFTVIRRTTKLEVKESVFELLTRVLRFTMPINLFLLGCEVFHEFYTGTLHSTSARYLYFGLHGHSALSSWIWTAVLFNVSATVILHVPRWSGDRRVLFLACGLTIVGIWIEKGMGLIFPGFIPSPLGEIVEYSPNAGEIFVSLGVLALGALMFTLMAKVVIAILVGDLRAGPVRASEAPPPP